MSDFQVSEAIHQTGEELQSTPINIPAGLAADVSRSASGSSPPDDLQHRQSIDTRDKHDASPEDDTFDPGVYPAPTADRAEFTAAFTAYMRGFSKRAVSNYWHLGAVLNLAKATIPINGDIEDLTGLSARSLQRCMALATYTTLAQLDRLTFGEAYTLAEKAKGDKKEAAGKPPKGAPRGNTTAKAKAAKLAKLAKAKAKAEADAAHDKALQDRNAAAAKAKADDETTPPLIIIDDTIDNIDEPKPMTDDQIADELAEVDIYINSMWNRLQKVAFNAAKFGRLFRAIANNAEAIAAKLEGGVS